MTSSILTHFLPNRQMSSFLRHDEPKSVTHLGRVWTAYSKIHESHLVRDSAILAVSAYVVSTPFTLIALFFAALADSTVFLGKKLKNVQQFCVILANKTLDCFKKFSVGAIFAVISAPIVSAIIYFLESKGFLPNSDGKDVLFETIEKVNDAQEITFDAETLYNNKEPIQELVNQINQFLSENDFGDNLLSVSRFKIILAANVGIIGPIVEEVLFRGLIQDVLLKRMPQYVVSKISPQSAASFNSTAAKVIRIAITALLFALVHLTNLILLANAFVIAQVVGTFILGIGFGMLKESEYGLMGSIGAHCINNMIAITPLLLSP